jgi:hypothetical protein
MRFSLLRLVFGVGLLVSLAVPSLRAQGAPPFSTNDPETPGAGKWEVNLLGSFGRRPGERSVEGPTLDLNYGIGDRWQVSYEISRLSLRADGQPKLSGWSNSAAGLKWRFLDGGEEASNVSVYPQIEFNTPGSSSRRKGLVDADTTLTLPVQAQREVGAFTVVGEIGHAVHFHRHDEWFAGIAVGRKFGAHLEAGVELFGHGSEHLSRSDLLLNFGARLAVDERNGLVLALGRELHNHFEPRASFVGLIGWQFLH